MYNHHRSFALGYLVHKNVLMRERLYSIKFEDSQVFRDVFFKEEEPEKPVTARFLGLCTYPELLCHDTVHAQFSREQDSLQRFQRNNLMIGGAFDQLFAVIM